MRKIIVVREARLSLCRDTRSRTMWKPKCCVNKWIFNETLPHRYCQHSSSVLCPVSILVWGIVLFVGHVLPSGNKCCHLWSSVYSGTEIYRFVQQNCQKQGCPLGRFDVKLPESIYSVHRLCDFYFQLHHTMYFVFMNCLHYLIDIAHSTIVLLS